MFHDFLGDSDAGRVAKVLMKLSACGFHEAALTGGIALEAQLTARGRTPRRRGLNDLDFVVESFEAIPGALADAFLLHHIHPEALPGKMLLQLIDREQGLRIDLFRALGATLPRADTFEGLIGPLRIVSIEDLLARTTSHLYAGLRHNRSVGFKHAQDFGRFAGLSKPEEIDAAWKDHRESHEETFPMAEQETKRLLAFHPGLLVDEKFSRVITHCTQCRDHGRFQRADSATIVRILGYW